MSVLSPARLLPLCAGLAVGGCIAWAIKSLPPRPSPAQEDSSAVPNLNPTESQAAIAAWLALTLPADGATLTDSTTPTAALHALLTLLPNDGVASLIAVLATRPDTAHQRFLEIAFETWLERDPASVARWITTAAQGLKPELRLQLARQTGLAWAQIDFDAAYTWAVTLSDPGLAHPITRFILTQLADSDAPRALGLAQALGPEFTASIREVIFQTWEKTDSIAALRALGRELLDADPANPSVTQALGDWIAHNPTAGLAWLKEEGPANRHDRQDLLRRSLLRAAQNPACVGPLADTLAGLANWPDRQIALESLLSGWIERDPAAANVWLKQHEEIDLPLANVIARGTGERLAALAGTDPTAALKSFEALPPGDLRHRVAPALALAWAKTDPAAATRWLATTLPAIPPGSIIRTESEPDRSPSAWIPPAAPELLYSAQILANTLTDWVEIAPQSALRWSESLADPGQREIALAAIALGASPPDSPSPRPDPVERADLLSQLGDPALRTDYLSKYLGHWLQNDFTAAREWMQIHNPLPDADAARLLAKHATSTAVP